MQEVEGLIILLYFPKYGSRQEFSLMSWSSAICMRNKQTHKQTLVLPFVYVTEQFHTSGSNT